MQSWSGHQVLEPSELESRFSNEDGMAFLDSVFTEPSEEDEGQISRIKDVLDLLPPREADFIDLYYFKRLKQTDISVIFGVSQPTVCYRLARAADRIRFLLGLPVVDQEELARDLAGFLADPLDVQIMVHMGETTCQSEVAKRLGVSQGLVRHRFLRSLQRMKNIERLDKYVVLFDHIAANLNILHEVPRSTWNDQVVRLIN